MKISGKIVDIHAKRVFPGEIEILGDKIINLIEVSECPDLYIMPGFVDAHVHVESSMLIPAEFARVCVRHGTVGVVSDPHEIANVCGVEGVDFMIENGKQVPFLFHFGAPSCVPATSFESSGSSLDADAVESLLKRSDVYFLSEMMNFPGAIHGDEQVLRKINAANRLGKKIDGHAPGVTGQDLQAYIGRGISTDHECMRIDEAREKIRLGMKILIREGSAARNFGELAPLIREFPDKVMFCTDDSHPDTLIRQHILHMVRSAIEMGYDLFDVLRAANQNPVDHYGLKIGLLRKGDDADFILVDNLNNFKVIQTFVKGRMVYEAGMDLFVVPKPQHIPNLFVAGEILPEDLRIKDEGKKIRIMGIIDGELITTNQVDVPLVSEGWVIPDTDRDILKIAVINRYQEAPPQMAFVRGLGLKRGALASTIAHDSHNIVAVGTNDKDIAMAVNLVVKSKGGLALADGERKKILPLPVAGLMSTEPAETVSEQYRELESMAAELGSVLQAPFMTISFLSLLVIPELKLGDKGLFDVKRFQFTSLFV